MDCITEVSINQISKSNYVQLSRLSFKQEEKEKCWDVIHSHDSVSILIHNTTRDVFVLVKQFRAAVLAAIARSEQPDIVAQGRIDTTLTPGNKAVTHELCAGIIDKSESVAEIAKMELMEEVGYDVPVDRLEKMTSALSSVGISGARQTMFYAAVTDEDRKGPGGGNPAEGERIEVVEIPVSESLKFAFDESIEKPMGLIGAILWFHQIKAKTSTS